MSSDYETRVTKLVVLQKGKDLYDESATTVEITDESGGEFLIVSQVSVDAGSMLKIDAAQWPHIRAAIDRLAGDCRG